MVATWRSLGAVSVAVVAAAVYGAVPSGPVEARLAASTALIMRGTHIGRQLDDPHYLAYAQGFIDATTGAQDSAELVDVPGQLWPFTGLNSRTFDASVAQGKSALETDLDPRIAAGDSVVVFGHSQSAVIASEEKQRLLDQYGDSPTAPDVKFVVTANPDRPNGGLLARFPGLHIPLLDVTFNGPAPTGTAGDSFTTYDIARQYDGWADFPSRPLNLVAVANAVAGIYYLHGHYDDQITPQMLEDPQLTQKSTYGDTTYYLVYTPHLPLLQPLRDLGVPESFVGAIEPFLRKIVELGYDRQTPLGEPTPAKLSPINLQELAPAHPGPDAVQQDTGPQDIGSQAAVPQDTGQQDAVSQVVPKAVPKIAASPAPEPATAAPGDDPGRPASQGPIVRTSLRAVVDGDRRLIPSTSGPAGQSRPADEQSPDTSGDDAAAGPDPQAETHTADTDTADTDTGTTTGTAGDTTAGSDTGAGDSANAAN